jgi:hypothetical protein
MGPSPAESTRAYAFWVHQMQKCTEEMWRAYKHIVEESTLQEDAQSSIGCLACEKHGYAYCTCQCNACGNKYCTGVCEYVY